MATKTKTPAKRRGHEYTPEEIDRALLSLALYGGNSLRAREALKHDPNLQRVPDSSRLRVWKYKHADRYAELCAQHAPQVEQRIIHTYREIAAAAAEATLEGVQHTRGGLNQLDAKDASTATRNLALTAGIVTDKQLVLEGRPTSITERADPERDLELLARRLGVVVDSTAEEIEDAAEAHEPTHPSESPASHGDTQAQTRALPPSNAA